MEIKLCKTTDLTHEQLCKVMDLLLEKLQLVLVKESTPDYVDLSVVRKDTWEKSPWKEKT